MKLQQKQTPSFLDTFWSIDLIHRIVLQLVSVHQKSVYLYFFLPHLKYFFVSSLLSSSLLLICWKSLQFVPKKLEICCIDQFTDVMVSSFTFSLLFAIFSFSLITSFNMSRSLAFWKHSWIILLDAHPVNSSTERSRAVQSILNWNSVLDQISFLICIFILVETGFIGKKCWLSGSAQYFWRFSYFDRRTLFWW